MNENLFQEILNVKPDTYTIGKYDVTVSKTPLGVEITYVLNELEDKLKLKKAFFDFLEQLEDELFEETCLEISKYVGNSFLHDLSEKFEHIEEFSFKNLENDVNVFRDMLRRIVLKKVSKWFTEYSIKPSELEEPNPNLGCNDINVLE